MTPQEELELLKLRKRKLELEQQNLAGQGESEGGDDGEGEFTPAPSKAGETAFDAVQGGTRGVTLGLNDVVAGLGAAAGDLYQSTVDGRPRNPNAYAEGVAEERARDAASKERSPNAYGRSQLAGVVATAPLIAAKPVQLATRAASGAPVAVGAVADAAAPALARYGRAAGSSALSALGFSDVDKLEDVPSTALGGAALGVGGEALATGVKSGMASGISPADLMRSGSLKSADALKALIGKVDDAVGFELPMFGGREAEKVLRRLGAGAADLPPPPTIPQDKTTYEFMQSLGDEFAPLAPVAPKPAPVVPPKANPLAALVDEPMPTMPPRNPRTPLDQIPRAAPPMPAPAPVAPPAPAPGAAIPLSDAELQAMIRGVNTSPQMRQLERVQQQMTRAPGVATDPLDDMSKRLIRQGNASTSNTNPVAIDDVGGRPPKVVAAVGQQEKWRGIYDRLSPDQRASFIEQLRNESGLTDDQIRQRLKLTLAEWRRKSFTREAP
jgi:hypothetical protein